jgi:hypothetical protein
MMHLSAVMALLMLISCAPQTQETPIDLPLTYPLSRVNLGYGLVIENYTRLLEKPDDKSGQTGLLRQGDIVILLERRIIKPGVAKTREYWDLCRDQDGKEGWLPQNALHFFERKEMAETAKQELSK